MGIEELYLSKKQKNTMSPSIQEISRVVTWSSYTGEWRRGEGKGAGLHEKGAGLGESGRSLLVDALVEQQIRLLVQHLELN